MKDEYKIGVYGFFEFTIKKLLYGTYYKNYFQMYGEIIKVDEQAIIIEDCYGFTYRIFWPRLIRFEKQDKPTEIKL